MSDVGLKANVRAGMSESVVLELRDKRTGFLKQRKTIKNGVETDEFFAPITFMESEKK